MIGVGGGWEKKEMETAERNKTTDVVYGQQRHTMEEKKCRKVNQDTWMEMEERTCIDVGLGPVREGVWRA